MFFDRSSTLRITSPVLLNLTAFLFLVFIKVSFYKFMSGCLSHYIWVCTLH